MTSEAAGTLIEGRYTLGSKLSERGGIECHFGLDTQSCEPVTVWTFQQGLRPRIEAFLSEAKRLALLSHPSLIEVLSYGCHEGLPYLVTADGEGLSLGRMLERGTELSSHRRLQILGEVGGALGAAHQAGFQHGSFDAECVVFGGDGETIVRGVGLNQLARALSGARDGQESRASIDADRRALWALSEAMVTLEAAPEPATAKLELRAPAASRPPALGLAAMPPPAPAATIAPVVPRSTPISAPPPVTIGAARAAQRQRPPPPPPRQQAMAPRERSPASRPPLHAVPPPPRAVRASAPPVPPVRRLPYPSLVGIELEASIPVAPLRPSYARWVDGLGRPKQPSSPLADLMRVAAVCAAIFVMVVIVTGA